MGSRATSQGLIELGERIRKRRQELHWSQEKLAEEADISLHTVCRIEGGQTAMSVETFKKIVEILEIDASKLLGGNTSVNREKNVLHNMFFRISHLDKGNQEIVLQTMDTLIKILQNHK